MKSSDYYSTQRIGIFIDVQNLYHSAKNLYRARVNYSELIKNLVGERQLIRAMAYVAKSETGVTESPLHERNEVSGSRRARGERRRHRDGYLDLDGAGGERHRCIQAVPGERCTYGTRQR